LTCSALVAQAGVPGAEEDGATTAGVLLLLVAAGALGALELAAGVEPDAAGWLLPERRGREGEPPGPKHHNSKVSSETTKTRFTMPPQARTSGSKPETAQACAGL
jgi:hypothetical protein